MFTLKLKFGNGMLEYQSPDIKTVHKFSAIWGALPQTCQVCQGKNVILNHKSPGGNDYYGIRCIDCGAELNLHQKKEGGGFYIKSDDKMKVWEGKSDNGDFSKDWKNAEPPVKKDGDIPF